MVEWVDRANMAHVMVSEHVMKTAAQRLMAALPPNDEDYSDFIISNGWLNGVKQRHRLSSKKTRGDGGSVDEGLLPEMQRGLQEQLADFAPQDIWNCDELALQ